MTEPPWTIRSVLAWTSQHFEKLGIDGPRLTAEILLAHALDANRVRLYVDLDRPRADLVPGVYSGIELARRAIRRARAT